MFHSRRNTSWTISSASVGSIEQTPGQPEDRAGVAAVRLGQRVLVIAADRHDEASVAGLLQIDARHGLLAGLYGAEAVRGCPSPRLPVIGVSSERDEGAHHLDVRGVREEVDEARADVAEPEAGRAGRRRGRARPDRSSRARTAGAPVAATAPTPRRPSPARGGSATTTSAADGRHGLERRPHHPGLAGAQVVAGVDHGGPVALDADATERAEHRPACRRTGRHRSTGRPGGGRRARASATASATSATSASAPSGRDWKNDVAEMRHRRPATSSWYQARRPDRSSSAPTTATSSGTLTSSAVGVTTTSRSPVRAPARSTTSVAAPNRPSDEQLGHQRMGDQAVVDQRPSRGERRRRYPARPPATVPGRWCGRPRSPSDGTDLDRRARRCRPCRCSVSATSSPLETSLGARHRRAASRSRRTRRPRAGTVAAGGPATRSTTSRVTAAGEARRLLDHLGEHLLAGQRARHEHHPAVGLPGHRLATDGDRGGLELEGRTRGASLRWTPVTQPTPQPGGHRPVRAPRRLLPARRGVRGAREGRCRPDPVGRHGRPVRAEPHHGPRHHRRLPQPRLGAVRGPPDGEDARRSAAPATSRPAASCSSCTPRRSPTCTARSATSGRRARPPAVAINPATPVSAVAPRARSGRHGAGDDGEPRVRRPGLHRHDGAEDRRAAPARGRRRLRRRHRGGRRHRSRHGRRRGGRRAPTCWWPAAPCSATPRVSSTRCPTCGPGPPPPPT